MGVRTLVGALVEVGAPADSGSGRYDGGSREKSWEDIEREAVFMVQVTGSVISGSMIDGME